MYRGTYIDAMGRKRREMPMGTGYLMETMEL